MSEVVNPHIVSTDALATLGTIIDESQGRDAIHLGVENAIAAERLYPGQHVTLASDGARASGGKLLGIVDPFLRGPVYEGQRFWLVVYPRQITSLRHVWEHPDFPPSQDKVVVEYKSTVAVENKVDRDRQEALLWLKKYAERLEARHYSDNKPTAFSIIGWIDEYIDGDRTDNFAYIEETVYVEELVWEKFTAYTGREVPKPLRVSEILDSDDDGCRSMGCSC